MVSEEKSVNRKKKLNELKIKLRKIAIIDYLYLIIGVVFYTFISWRWNMVLAAWISPIFLMRFFRNQKKFWPTLIALPLLFIGTYLKMRNGWNIAVMVQLVIALLYPILFVMIPLYLDRFVTKRYTSLLSTLVYPSVMVLFEFLMGLTLMGSLFGVGISQFKLGAFIQLSSITGIWGLSFLICWTASIINTLWEAGFELQLKKISRPAKIYSVIIIFTILFGAFRLAVVDPSAPTVKVAAISVEHPQDYWSAIVDKKTPASEAVNFLAEFQELENESFRLSEQAANAGAKIIFWAEGNLPYYEDYETEFFNRSKAFAIDHQVYFAPGVVKFYYNSYVSDNKVVMFDPNGTIAYEYIKTKSWYETNSDGIIDYIDTPYGRIASTICFDNDFPNFIRAVGKARVDILLIPSFDNIVIKDYHCEAALFRGLENGVSVVRHSNKGASYAIDYLGNVVAYQDFFDTEERLMFADVPTKGVFTLYSVLGDWFFYFDALLLGVIITDFIFRKVKKRALFSKPEQIVTDESN